MQNNFQNIKNRFRKSTITFMTEYKASPFPIRTIKLTVSQETEG